eukprot:7597526-Karenia_brevis.AAC.1
MLCSVCSDRFVVDIVVHLEKQTDLNNKGRSENMFPTSETDNIRWNVQVVNIIGMCNKCLPLRTSKLLNVYVRMDCNRPSWDLSRRAKMNEGARCNVCVAT